MELDARTAITDSPWFWVLAFSLMALVALVAVGGKYGRRQTQLELQYQARQRVAERIVAENNLADEARNDTQTDRRQFSSPGQNLIPLWPLAILLVLVSVFSIVMLSRGRAGGGDGPARAPDTA